MTRVLITASFPNELLDKIRSVSNRLEVEQIQNADRHWPADKTTEAEIIYAMGDAPPPDLAPNLRWVQTHWAGVDHMVNKPIWNSGIVLTTASGVHTTNIAQYVFTQLLYWSGRVSRWRYYQARSEWPRDRWEKFVPQEMRGATLGILGYGSIGREIARIGKVGFGLRVLATKRNARRLEDEGYRLTGTGDPSGEMVDRIYPTEATRSMLGECDFVVVTLPLTPDTHHFINEDLLRAMKPDAYLVNIGRGQVVHESDLIKALKKGWIGGAGLDVFETEPLPADSPLWQMENVLITPHVSGFTPFYDARATDIFVENLRRYLAGEPLLNVVNRELGY